jgi:hypothetical protein
MVWNGDVVLAKLVGDKTNMTAGLTTRFVTNRTQGPYQFDARQISWQSHTPREMELNQRIGSTCQYFLTHKMKSDDLWRFTFVKMALNSIPHVTTEVLQRISVREDGMTKRPGGKTAFCGIFHKKY